jgi:hypothetical protein
LLQKPAPLAMPFSGIPMKFVNHGMMPRYPQYLTAKAVYSVGWEKKKDSEKKIAGGTIKFWLLRNMGQKGCVG